MSTCSPTHGARPPRTTESGFTLIEVMVTSVILAIGLLGLAGLQARVVGAELDAYQRSHALILLEDMTARIDNNRRLFKDADYSSVLAAGTGTADADCAALTGVAAELCWWDRGLKGAAVTRQAGGNTERIGAMNQARGCIERVGVTLPVTLRVSVAWQGTIPTLPPPGELSCGADADVFSGDLDSTRRVLSVLVTLAELASP